MARRMQSFEQDGEIDNLLVRIRCIIVMIRWTGLAPLECEFRSGKSAVCRSSTHTFIVSSHSKPHMGVVSPAVGINTKTQALIFKNLAPPRKP